MENDRLLALIQAEKDALLDQAYILEDGRRVFRTEDGRQVFDEFGQEISAMEIDPMMIPDSAPTWETYSVPFNEEIRLQAERTQILEYQQQLDDAREALENGDITQAELEGLQTSLAEDMPDAVRMQLPTDHPTAALEQTAEVSAPAVTTPDISDLQGFTMPVPGG